MKKILVAYDANSYSLFALDKAVEVAKEEGAEITVLSVVTPDAQGSKSGGHMGLRPHADTDVAYAKGYLDERGVHAETKVARGHAADEILREARLGGFDLIIVGSREHGPIVGRLLGSVSRKVAQEAPCAVIVAGKSGASRMEPTVATPA
jgi:nucleotide-binding universal stress UspA family protein